MADGMRSRTRIEVDAEAMTPDRHWNPRVRPSEPARDSAARATLPLWLTEAEAEYLLVACSSSAVTGAATEPDVFRKLGELLRTFRR